ncbi:MAG: helix-hairpin-helix domain-containing protein [Planctomycetota bacterium]
MPPSEQPPTVSRILRPRDQLTVGLLVAAALVTMATLWWLRGGSRGQFIVIDAAPPQQARYGVDLNEADWPELIHLPGLGPTLARRVVAERAARGPFTSVEDVLRVDGIGPVRLEKLRPFLLPLPASAPASQQ